MPPEGSPSGALNEAGWRVYLRSRTIAHEQIHGRAAEAILGRFITLFPGRRFPTPADIVAVPARKMRRAGFSRAGVREGFKVAYGRRKQPTPKQLRRHGERWRPYRSVAA